MLGSADFPQSSDTGRQVPGPGMSAPAPKRSVPVNLLNLSEEDSFGPFAEDTQILGGTRAIRSPLMELNAAASQEGRMRLPLGSTARTPELFDLNGESLGLELRPASRGVIGSARKCRSSASILDDALGAPESVGSSSLLDQSSSLQGGAGSESGKRGAWDSVVASEVRMQSPIGRPTSTPAYATGMSGLFGGSLSIGGAREGALADSGLAAVTGDLNLSGSGSALSGVVRGRDRDYSFGSLLGLPPAADGGVRSGVDAFVASQRTPSAPLESLSLYAQSDSTQLPSRGNSRASASIFADSVLPEPLGLGLGPVKTDMWPPSAGTSREQEIRSSLPLTGTVSAPPLLNMYSYGYESINNTSAFGTTGGPSGRFDPLKSRYDTAVMGLSSAAPPGRIAEQEQADILRLNQQSRTPPPAEALLVPQSAQLAAAAPDPESVEGLVLRSCRDILAGAAEHSLKAVELANTLRARVGTEALARIREKWGGLLSLLEKHGTIFRVDRIPKNDKVTLILGAGDDDIRGGNQSGAQGRREVFGDGAQSTPQSRMNVHSTQDGEAAAGANGSGATRCLHVGNVPANMTESQLAREFEKFGQLEGIKLVAQRNGTRRFAFITFVTVDQAVSARHALSKVHPWKSAISFAHKDFGGSNTNQQGEGAPRSGHHVGGHSTAAMPAQTRNGYHNPATGGKMYGGGMSDYQAHMMYQQQMQHQQQGGGGQHMMMGGPGAAQYPYMNMNMNMGMPYGAGGGPLYWMQPPLAGPGAQFPGGPPSMPIHQQMDAYGFPPQYQARPPATAVAAMDPDCPVLQRLCDDTYVPTQPWPVDARDQTYCAAVVAQLQQFGGCTTVSKLRGFLRNRISAVDNIKSVPLKAMLVAYPQLFVLENNYVYLVGGAGASDTGSVLQSAYANNI